MNIIATDLVIWIRNYTCWLYSTWFYVPWTHKTVDFHYRNKCSKCLSAFSFIHILAHFAREWSWDEDSHGNWYMWPLQSCDELDPYICFHKQGLECIPTFGSPSSWGPVISASQCCGFPTGTPVTRKVQFIKVIGASIICWGPPVKVFNVWGHG